MKGYTKSIRSDGNEEWIIDNLEEKQIEWAKEEVVEDPNAPQLSASDIKSWQDSQYQRDRKVKYDALNQLELISDDAINGTTTHKDAILAIKDEIPKPTGE